MPVKTARIFSVGHTWPSSPGGGAPLLLSSRYGRRPAPRKIARQRLCAWVIDYSFLGGMRYRVGSRRNRWRTRESHSARLYAPGQFLWEDPSRMRRAECLSAHIIFTGGDSVGLRRLTGSAGVAEFSDKAGLLAAPMREIAETGQTMGDGGFCRANALMWQAIGLLLASKPAGDVRLIVAPRALRRARSALCRRIEAYFEEHAHEKITRAVLAREFHLSVSSLSHSYRAETGMSPMQQLIRVRINRAKHLILRGAGLKQVAEETGFNDQFHLSKTFKRIEGMSPRLFPAGWLRSGRPAGSDSDKNA